MRIESCGPVSSGRAARERWVIKTGRTLRTCDVARRASADCRCSETPPAHARTSALASGWRDAGAAYEVSWKTAARSASRKSCRAVSRSTMRMGAPQRGHGHDDLGVEATTRFVRRRRGDGEGLTTLGELASTTARGEEAEVADADEALRQDVQEKPSQEFVGVERERADLAPVPIVLPPKRDGVVGDGDEPVIGDGDAVGVAREVVQHVGRAAKGRLRVDHPRLAIEGSEPRAKGRRQCASGCEAAREMTSGPAERRPAGRRRVCPRKTCRSTLTGRKKVGRAWIHRVPSGDSPPAGTTQWTCG